MKVAVLDDWLKVARDCGDWSALEKLGAEPVFFPKAFESESEAARDLKQFEIILAMRDRTAFPSSLVDQLPNLKMLAFSGPRATNIDVRALQRKGVTVCYTTIFDFAGEMTAELSLALIMAAAKKIPAADASMRAGHFQQGIPPNILLHGKTLGILGLGRIGSIVARYGHVLGMKVVAWSQNMTEETAAASGAKRVSKEELFATSDVISLHLVLSDRSRGIVGRPELGQMKSGAILVNTARGPLVDERALVEKLSAGDIFAALDVYDREPLPRDHALRRLENVVLTPHIMLCNLEALGTLYRGLIEDAVAFLKGDPVRVCPAA